MDKNLQQRLESALDGNNKEAAWAMGLRYLSEETLCWAMGANYGCVDDVYDVEKFIEDWQSNTEYEIVANAAFECKADIAVAHDSESTVMVTLYGAATEDPRLYANLLHNIANWIETNGDVVNRREEAAPDLLSDVAMHGAEYVQWANRALARGGEDQEDTPEHTRITVINSDPRIACLGWAAVDIEKKENNTSMLERCAICGDHFEAELGLWPFIAGTWNPICMTCCGIVVPGGFTDTGEWVMSEEQKKEAIVTDLVQGMQSGDTYCDVCDVCLAWGENIDISFDGRHDDNGDPIPTVRCEECAEKVIA